MPGVAASLERLYPQVERWAEQADLLHLLSAPLADPEKADMLVREAALRRGRLDQVEQATVLYGEALALAPGMDAAIVGLEGIDTPAARAFLEGAYESRASHDKLRDVLTRQLDTAPAGEWRSIRDRLAVLLSESLGDAPGALAVVKVSFQEDPNDGGLWDQLFDYAARADAMESTIAFMREVVDEAPPDIQATLHGRAAEVLSERVGDLDAAAYHHGRVLAADSHAEASFQALKAHYTEREQWRNLDELYRTRLDAAEGDETKLELLQELAFLYDEILEDFPRAVATYEGIRALRPDHEGARIALVRHYRRAERWPELGVVLLEVLESAEGPDRIRTLVELADIHERRLDDPKAAVAFYGNVLDEQPSHMRAQGGIAKYVDHDTLGPSVAARLVPIYERQGAWVELHGVLDTQLANVSDPHERRVLLGKKGELEAQRLGDPAAAFSTYSQLLRLDPADSVIREACAASARQSGQLFEWARTLDDLATTPDIDARTRRDLLVAAAFVWDNEVGDRARAQGAHARILGLEGVEEDVALRSAEALERIARAKGDPMAIREALQAQVVLANDPEDAWPRWMRLGEVCAEDGLDGAAAVDAFAEAVRLKPDDDQANNRLAEALERVERWAELADHLERWAALDQSDPVRLWLWAARVCETYLHADERALDMARRAHEAGAGDGRAMEALADRLQRSGAWSELVQVLEEQYDTLEDPARRNAVRLRIARIVDGEMGDIPSAVERYADVLEEDPSAQDALTAILSHVGPDQPVAVRAAQIALPHLNAEDHPNELERVLRVLATDGDAEEQWVASRRLADLLESRQQDTRGAFEVLARVARLHAAGDDAKSILGEVERLAVAGSLWSEWAALLTDVENDLTDGEFRFQVLLKVATLADRHLGDHQVAIRYFERVLEEKANHRDAMDALERLYEQEGQYEPLLGLLQRRAAVATNPKDRAQLLMRCALVSEGGLEDYDSAIASMEQLLDDGDSLVVYQGLERLYRKAGRWADLFSSLEQQLEGKVGDPAEIHLRLGVLCRGELGDEPRAMEHFEAALALRPDHEGVARELEAMMANEVYRSAAAELLEPFFLRRLDWPKVTSILDARIEAEPNEDARKALLRRRAQILEDYMEDLDGALEANAALFREDPADVDVRDTLVRLARVQDKRGRLAEVYGEILEDVAVDSEATADLAYETGQLHALHTGNLELARRFFERAHRFEPTPDTFDALEKVLANLGDLEAVGVLYRERALEATGKERLDFLRKLAVLQREQRKDLDEALLAYEDILQIEPDDESALESIAEVLKELERWDDLVDHLRRWRDLGSAEQDVSVIELATATLLLEKVDRPEDALDVLEGLLERDPRNAGAIAYLEKKVQGEQSRLRITGILENVYRQADQWRKLIAILEARNSLFEEPSDRIPLLMEIAVLHEERGQDFLRAFNAWSRAFVLDPFATAVREHVERLAQAMPHWDGLVSTFEQAAEVWDDPDLKYELLQGVADVHVAHRRDGPAAIAVYRRLSELDPDDTASLDALVQLYSVAGDWEAVLQTLDAKIDRTVDTFERAALHRQKGAVREEHLGDVEGAIACLRDALEEDPSDRLALAELDRLHVGRGDGEALAEVLRRRIDLGEDTEERVALGLRLGALLSTSPGAAGQAIDAFERVLEEEPTQGKAILALTGLYERSGRWADLLRILDLQVELSSEVDQKVGHLCRSGEVYEKELDDVPAAIERYGQGLILDPGNRVAISSLRRIAQLEEHRSAAVEVLAPVLSQQESWDDYVELLELQIDGTVDPVLRVECLERVADVHEDKRGDRNMAFVALRRAFEEDPESDSLRERIDGLSEALGNHGARADLYEMKAPSVVDPLRARDLWVTVARLSETELANPDRAIRAYRAAIERVGDEPELLEGLDGLYAQGERWDELGDLLERRMTIETDTAAKVNLCVRLGDLRVHRTGDPRRALRAYQDAVELDAANEGAIQGLGLLLEDPSVARDAVVSLEETYRRLDRPEEVARLFEMRVEMAESDGERVGLLMDLADHIEEKLGDLSRALWVLRRALCLNPTEDQVIERIERLAEEGGDYEPLRGLAEEVLKKPGVPRECARDLLYRAAHWYRDGLGLAEDALRVTREGLAVDRRHEPFHVLHVELLRQLGREVELVAALRELASFTPDEERQVAYLEEAVGLAEDGGQPGEVLADCYVAILEIQPLHRRALERLREIRVEEGRWEDVVELGLRSIEAAPELGERTALRSSLATIYLRRLKEPAQAMAMYEAILEEEPESTDTMDSLLTLLEGASRWDSLEVLLARRAAVAEGAEAGAFHVRRAAVLDRQLDRGAEAEALLQEFLRGDPYHSEALHEYTGLLETHERWEELSTFLEGRAEMAEEAGRLDDAIDGWLELARVRSEHFRDGSEEAVYRKVLERAPDHAGAVRALVALEEMHGRWDEVAAGLERLMGLELGTKAMDAALRLAEVAQEHLADSTRAEEALHTAFQLDPSRTDVRDRLRLLLEAGGRWEEALRLLEMGERHADQGAERAALLKDMARIASEHLGDPGRAAHYYERAVEEEPADRDALLPLCDLYIEGGRTEDAIGVLRRIIESFGAKRVREVAKFHHRLGRALEAQGDREGALEAYDAAFKADLTNIDVLRDLALLSHGNGDYERAQKTFRALLLQKLTPEHGITKADVYFYLGEVAAKQGDTKKAISMLERAMIEDRGHGRAEALLGTLRGG
ncbi:MAG: tetratricopeptide repeat protein [Myxococcales bacterium]|nr:tetratricopeptide repeat protein [Myxococcales bacterium]